MPRHRWRLRPSVAVAHDLAAEAADLGISRRLLAILCARGLADRGRLGALVGAPETGLHDPRLLPDAAAFAARVEQAGQRSERVLVFGDFDADGLSGLAIMATALRRRGLDAEPYVPDRTEEGHGLSSAAVERAQVDGRTLIVTVDCGTSSAPEIAAAATLGIDVLVTDHHRVTGALPPAVAVVNPQRLDAVYPGAGLAGAGVAFKLAQLLLGAGALDLADLATIGTVADVAPIVGENRAIARLGLAQLRANQRPGIRALLAKAGVDAARLDLEQVAFAIAPRLNAVGRIGHGGPAVRLLLAQDAAEADGLALELDAANGLRRELLATALAEARVALAGTATPPTDSARGSVDGPVIVIAGPWPVGIVGLVAGRLADEFGRPAVVFSNQADPWRGSARSPGNFDLAAAFGAMADLFWRFGGHSAAAGCHLSAENYDLFRRRLGQLAADVAPVEPSLTLDLIVGALDADYRLLRELATLEPTGTGNPPPIVGIEGLVVVRVRPARGGHTQLVLRKGREVLDGICFGRDDLDGQLTQDQPVDVVARLASRVFGGYESLQLEVRDLAPAGTLANLRLDVDAGPAATDLAQSPARPLALPTASAG